ncbi:MAG: hypothetical protein WC628_09300 [Candidatus Omnitrophota bacterium]
MIKLKESKGYSPDIMRPIQLNQNRITILTCLILIFYSTAALAEKAASKETIPVKREISSKSNTIITQPRPAPNQPAPSNPAVKTRSEVRKPLLNFRVNPPVKIIKSSLLIDVNHYSSSATIKTPHF